MRIVLDQYWGNYSALFNLKQGSFPMLTYLTITYGVTPIGSDDVLIWNRIKPAISDLDITNDIDSKTY